MCFGRPSPSHTLPLCLCLTSSFLYAPPPFSDSPLQVQARFQLPADMVPDGAAAAEAPPGSGAKIGVPTLDVSGDAPDAMVMSSPRLNRKCPAAAPPTKPVLQTFISLAAPHLGAVYADLVFFFFTPT